MAGGDAWLQGGRKQRDPPVRLRYCAARNPWLASFEAWRYDTGWWAAGWCAISETFEYRGEGVESPPRGFSPRKTIISIFGFTVTGNSRWDVGNAFVTIVIRVEGGVFLSIRNRVMETIPWMVQVGVREWGELDATGRGNKVVPSLGIDRSFLPFWKNF